MQFVPDKSSTLVRKVRNNIDRLFDKSLTDLIRGIRNNKENEARYIASCIEEIKVELRNDIPFIKANAVEKLSYLQMLGYDISWASFNIIEVMASSKFAEKRIGYLAATQSFTDETDVLMLTTNMIRKDLQSSNMYDVGEALSGMACFATPDLSRDLVNDVVNLLSSSRPYVRKKAVLLLYKIFLKYPESLRPTFPRLKEKLEDPDPGVQSAAVNVICELARKNPKNYLSLAPIFFKLMTGSSNNWMLIKIIKLFGSLVPLEVRLGKKLLEPLTNLINSTSAMSLLYECINTVIAVLVSISNEGPGDYTPSIQLCVQKLGVLIDDSDQNLKYLGLLAMGRILNTHPKAVQAHKDIVMRCLDDKDESIRLRALDLLYGMISKKNLMEIVKKLMEHVDAAEGSFYRDELLSRIICICSHNNYQYITNFEWYISVLVELTKVDGTKHGAAIAEQIQDVTVRVSSIRHFSVSQMALLIENANLLLAGSSSNICAVLATATWVCGEYSEHLNNAQTVLEAMIRAKLSIFPGPLISVYVQNIAKLYSRLLSKLEAEDDWDGVDSIDNLVLSKLPEFQYHTEHLEAQERACNFVELLRHVEKSHAARTKVAEAFAHLFDGELNPVAAKAQRKVPVAEGLDLDAWINEPEPESDEEESDSAESDDLFPTVASEQIVGRVAGHGINGEVGRPRGKARKVAAPVDEASIEESRQRRKIEQETNPYYMKSSSAKDHSSRQPSRPSKESSATAERTEKSSLVGSTTTQQRPEQLQSPLEIPGMIGLGRYLQQQDKTISWKQAKEKNATSGRRGKKAGEEPREAETKSAKTTGKSSKRRRAKMQNLSALSSSDDGAPNDANEEKNGGTVGVSHHHVNRGDGEMPDNALSSHGEEEVSSTVGRVSFSRGFIFPSRVQNHHLSSEFKALDMDLDEPLREDERLFVPKTYSHPFPQVGTSTSGTNPYKLPSNGRHIENGFEGEQPKRKPKKKLKAKKSAEERDAVRGESSKPDSERKAKRKGKKTVKTAKNEYTAIESSKTPVEGNLEMEEGGTDEIVSIMGATIAAKDDPPTQ